MHKTTFIISKMDCPSEEQLIRMKLSGEKSILSLEFDIPKRTLSVVHSANWDSIAKQLDSLNLGSSLLESKEVTEVPPSKDNRDDERALLWQVLAINFFFFGLELATGFISQSMGLVADSLDMLADSIVYGLALLAVGTTVRKKNNIAKAAGYFQIILALLGFSEVIRRFIGSEILPSFGTMMLISFFALVGNTLCLYLLQKSKSKEAHMQASMIFTSNDILVNFGVILAGGLVYVTDSGYPDLIIGTVVFVIVGMGAIKILKLAN